MALGVKAAETAVHPPDLNSLEGFFKVIDPAYRMNFRNISDEEGYKVRFLGKGHVQVANNTPTPDTVAYGILWGFAKMLLPKGTPYKVQAIDQKGQHKDTFEDHDGATVFEVRWDA
jgi:hypothetical protein